MKTEKQIFKERKVKQYGYVNFPVNSGKRFFTPW